MIRDDDREGCDCCGNPLENIRPDELWRCPVCGETACWSGGMESHRCP